MNQDLLQRIEKAIEVCKTDGIDIRDEPWNVESVIKVDKGATSEAAKNPGEALKLIKVGRGKYRYIPLKGVRLLFLGADNGDAEYSHWYVVERPDGQSFAIAHDFIFGQNQGVMSCDLSQIPAYLLNLKTQKSLVKAV